MAVLTPEEVAANRWPVLAPLDAAQGLPAVVLNRPVCVIGSRRGAVHLALPSPLVSKTHALIVRSGNVIYVRDLGSTNHMFVNDQAVMEEMLARGDVLRIGPYRFVCETFFPDERPAQSSPVPAHLDFNGSPAPFKRRTLLIGSRASCDLVLKDPQAAGVHAVAFELGGRHFLRDLGAELATFVDGNASRQAELRPGAEIRIGQTLFRYEADPGDVLTIAQDALHDDRPELFDETAELLDAMPDTLMPIDDVTGVIAEEPVGGAAKTTMGQP
jgi:pSer/pThr/pTyr-binding forkhead associated (FHA) protein